METAFFSQVGANYFYRYEYVCFYSVDDHSLTMAIHEADVTRPPHAIRTQTQLYRLPVALVVVQASANRPCAQDRSGSQCENAVWSQAQGGTGGGTKSQWMDDVFNDDQQRRQWQSRPHRRTYRCSEAVEGGLCQPALREFAETSKLWDTSTPDVPRRSTLGKQRLAACCPTKRKTNLIHTSISNNKYSYRQERMFEASEEMAPLVLV